ncbi:MAG: tetratricopeptide repeat protein [Gemmatimonadota bacterium]|nr:tetratricopeptide repeat protein [Gemmatimonadota bacterium]
MRGFRSPAAWLCLLALGGCASKGDLRRVEEQLLLSRGEQRRSDSARAEQLGQVVKDQQRIMDSLDAIGRGLSVVGHQVQGMRGDVANDLVSIQQQLVQVQALTGQSQQRLTELQTQVEARSEQLSTSSAAGDTTAAVSPIPAGNTPAAEQIYASSLQQLRRGSPGTARRGFRELLRLYPNHARVPDATYFVAETFAAESPDSATMYYRRVVEGFPPSPRAASALYKLGLLAERRKDLEGARAFYQRVVRDYIRSDEAALARDRLKTLGR